MAAFSPDQVWNSERNFEWTRVSALHHGDVEAADGLLDQCSILIELEKPEKAARLLNQRDPRVEDPEDIASLQPSLWQQASAARVLAEGNPPWSTTRSNYRNASQ